MQSVWVKPLNPEIPLARRSLELKPHHCFSTFSKMTDLTSIISKNKNHYSLFFFQWLHPFYYHLNSISSSSSAAHFSLFFLRKNYTKRINFFLSSFRTRRLGKLPRFSRLNTALLISSNILNFSAFLLLSNLPHLPSTFFMNFRRSLPFNNIASYSSNYANFVNFRLSHRIRRVGGYFTC